ncbi:MAG: dTDP-4-dehydrorhamnose reductase [Phycisphaerae bacterium]|nr:dTDP-4-dehydrorhamnose reductase [Phycisphaerae bacterium]
MKVLVTGAKGMLGRSLLARLSAEQCLGVDIDDFDIADARATDKAIGEYLPDAVIHCAAMTAVDDCETKLDLAFGANAVGSANVASACHRYGARLIAISTDYVFPGDLDRPYHEFDSPGPRNVYGASKLAGEMAVRRLCPNHLIVRIGWLYGPGGPSFVHTMLQLGAIPDADPVKVVNDQLGNPTPTLAVADHLAMLLTIPLAGMIHLTCEGEASWYDFAQEIFRIKGFKRPVVPCTTADFPRPAARPANSCLDNMVLRLQGLRPMPHWREGLEAFLGKYPDG